MVKQISQELEKRDIFADVHGRTKHIYSIYQKDATERNTFQRNSRPRRAPNSRQGSDPDCYARALAHSITNGTTIPTESGIGPVNV